MPKRKKSVQHNETEITWNGVSEDEADVTFIRAMSW